MLGLVHEIVPESQLQAKLQDWLAVFQECGPEAVRETKKLIAKIGDLNWTEVRQKSVLAISEKRVGVEGQEGLQSFLEKRPPSWRNS